MRFLSYSMLVSSLLLPLGAQSATQTTTIDDHEQRFAACTQCHGEYGYGHIDYPQIPRIAEKPAGYLHKQLMLFKSGERKHPEMNFVVRHLSPNYLKEMAEYYAKQEVPAMVYEAPELTEAQKKRAIQLMDEGDSVRSVPSCKQCHGQELTGVKPMIPGVINQSYEYTLHQMNQWRENERPVSSTYCMWVVANRMDADDVEIVSAWLATQPLPENREPVSVEELPEPLPGWCAVEEEK